MRHAIAALLLGIVPVVPSAAQSEPGSAPDPALQDLFDRPATRIEQPAPDSSADPARPSAWLGVTFGVGRSAAASGESGVDSTQPPPGVKVDGVFQGSPAEAAGLRGGDRILSVSGVPVNSPSELIAAVRALDPESWATLAVQRGRSVLDLRLRLSSRPQDTSGLRILRGWLGIKAIELPSALRTFFAAPEDAGILVSHVEPGSPAEAAGIQVGDVIFTAGEEPVESLDDLGRLVTSAGVDNKLEIGLTRNGARMVVEAKVGRSPAEKGAAR